MLLIPDQRSPSAISPGKPAAGVMQGL